MSKLNLTEQHAAMVLVDMNDRVMKSEYEHEYEKLRRQAEFEEGLVDYDDEFDFDNIEITSSLDSLVDDDMSPVSIGTMILIYIYRRFFKILFAFF